MASYWLMLLCVILVLLFACYKFLTWNFETFKKLGIQGPKPLPLFGTSLAMMREGVRKYDMDLRQQFGPVVGQFANRQPRLMVFDADILKGILGTEASNFLNRDMTSFPDYPVRSFLPLLKDNHWRHVRSLLTPAFSSGKIRKMQVTIEKCAQCLVNNLQQKADTGDIFDYFELSGAYTMDVIASTAFGLQIDSLNDPNNPFVRMSKKSMLFGTFNLLTLIHVFLPFMKSTLCKLGFAIFPQEAADFFVSAVNRAIQERKEDEQVERIDLLQLMINAESEREQLKKSGVPADDLVETDSFSSLKVPSNAHIWAHSHKGLSHEELLAQSILFILAGYETSRTALAFLGYQLAVNTDCQDKVIAEIDDVMQGRSQVTFDDLNKMKYLDMCLSETLRLYPPSARTDRMASNDINIKGVFIPKGMSIDIPIYAVHHDAEYWPEPERFDPERFSLEAKSARNPYCYLPFGIGPRNCIGMRLALIELKMATVHVLLKYRLVVCEQTQVPLRLGKLTMTPTEGIKLRVKSRD